MHWIVIHPVDSAILLLNNWDQKSKTFLLLNTGDSF